MCVHSRHAARQHFLTVSDLFQTCIRKRLNFALQHQSRCSSGFPIGQLVLTIRGNIATFWLGVQLKPHVDETNFKGRWRVEGLFLSPPAGCVSGPGLSGADDQAGCDTRNKAVICFEPTWLQILRRRLRHTHSRNQKIICSCTVENIEIFHHLMAALPPSLLRLSLPSRPCNYAHSRTLKPHSSNPVIFPGFFPLVSFERRKRSNFTHPPCSS